MPLEGEPAPSGRPFVSIRFDNRHGDSVQGFLVTGGALAVLVRPHGGPTWLDEDKWHLEVQSYVEAGMAVVLVNYRGSTGRGAEWRDALIGDVGGPELEDLNDALDHLIARGGGRDRAAIGGGLGGYLTLLMLGKHPERGWRCGIAGVPVGLRAVLRGFLAAAAGVRPGPARGPTRPGPRADGRWNPINFVDEVRAPVLFLIGEHDSRPYRQAMAYVDRLAARGHRGVPVPHGARVVRHRGGDPPAAGDPGLPHAFHPRGRHLED